MSSSRKDDQMLARRTLLQAAGAAVATGCVATRSEVSEPTAGSRWDDETDVIVVGSGIAGFGAAIEARNAGADVVILEKENWYGGNSRLSGGNCQVPGSHIQKAAGVEDSPDWCFEDIYKLGERRNNRALLRMFVDNAAETALWLEKLGLVWKETLKHQFDSRVPRTLSPAESPDYPGQRGVSIMHILHKAALQDRQIPLRFEHRLTHIIRDGRDGPVLGVQVEAKGETLRLRARKAVVIATGGFRSNRQMLRALDPRLDEQFLWVGYPNVTDFGEGHLAAQAVGAGFVDMSYIGFVFWSMGTRYWSTWDRKSLPGFGGINFFLRYVPRMILVANDARRFCNEDTFDTHYTSYRGPIVDAYLNLPDRPRTIWMLVDADGARELNWPVALFHRFEPENQFWLEKDLIATGETVDQLARAMPINAANLRATIDRYNGFAKSGSDLDFQRTQTMHPLVKPPFYAARVLFNMGDQSCGIRVNDRMQVIDHAWQAMAGAVESVPLARERIIPRLYAAGECIGGLFGAERGHGKMLSYLIHGRVAGRIGASEGDT